MLDYEQQALEHATYELIEDEESYYSEVPELKGVWATEKSLEECRRNLLAAIEDWLLFSIAKGLPIPTIGEAFIRLSEELTVAGELVH